MSTTTAPEGPSTARPAGPKGHWLAGQPPRVPADRLGFLDRTAPDATATSSPIRLGPTRLMVVNHPDLVEEVLVTKNRQFIKHFALRRRTRRPWATGC